VQFKDTLPDTFFKTPLMLLRDKLSLIQGFRLTWRPDLLIILVCSLAYAANTYWLKQHVSIPVTVSAVLGTALAFLSASTTTRRMTAGGKAGKYGARW
jgi:hypothetical protein